MLIFRLARETEKIEMEIEWGNTAYSFLPEFEFFEEKFVDFTLREWKKIDHFVDSTEEFIATEMFLTSEKHDVIRLTHGGFKYLQNRFDHFILELFGNRNSTLSLVVFLRLTLI